jgi:Fic family protein
VPVFQHHFGSAMDGFRHEKGPARPRCQLNIDELNRQMCAYVNEAWERNEYPVHLASYLMWRVNWIHPFFGGNGRTSRAISYMVLCAKLGFPLPGPNTIPDPIAAQRGPYFRALQAADAAYENGAIELSEMQELLGELLATQLLSVHEQATGKKLV